MDFDAKELEKMRADLEDLRKGFALSLQISKPSIGQCLSMWKAVIKKEPQEGIHDITMISEVACEVVKKDSHGNVVYRKVFSHDELVFI